MFTGIIEDDGVVVSTSATEGGYRLRIATDVAASELHTGQSISVNGACLTGEAFGDAATLDVDKASWFAVFLSAETVARTALDALDVGDVVNIERAMVANGRFDGHIVQGHVDATTEIRDVESVGEDWVVTYAIPDGYERYLVEKGSVTLDGISLTVASLEDDAFTVAIIPATMDATNLSEKEPGDPVHLEVDVIAKYVERLLEPY